MANQNILVLDPQAGELLARLRSQLRENTNEAVVRKALALLAQVVEVAGPERFFTVLTPQGRPIKIKLD